MMPAEHNGPADPQANPSDEQPISIRKLDRLETTSPGCENGG